LSAYRSVLIVHIDASLEGKKKSQYLLKQDPQRNSSQAILTGHLTKRGGSVKTWKKRFFIIRANGVCEYYAKFGDAKPKGTIDLEGFFFFFRK